MVSKMNKSIERVAEFFLFNLYLLPSPPRPPPLLFPLSPVWLPKTDKSARCG